MHAWRETGSKKLVTEEHTFGAGPAVWYIKVRCVSCGSVGFRRDVTMGWRRANRSQVVYTWEQRDTSACLSS